MVVALTVKCYVCHEVSWVKDMKARYTENRIHKNLSTQNGEDCGTDIYLQYRVFLFPVEGLNKNLFQQVPLHFYKKEHTGARLSGPPSSSLALPFTSTGIQGELSALCKTSVFVPGACCVELQRWFQVTKRGDRISPARHAGQHSANVSCY